jgi:hypothetical protein
MKKSQPPSERHYCHGALLELTCTYVSDTRIVSTIPNRIVILAFYSLVKVKARSASAVQSSWRLTRLVKKIRSSFDGSRSYPVTIS